MSEINYGKVLVVEDDSAIRETLRIWLKQAGFQVIFAHDGHQGLQAHLTESPDIIVLDVMLPGLDGLEVCRKIRSRSSVPIVMLSAHGESSDRILGLEIGADDYLPKPFQPRELIARIKAQLRGRELAGVAAKAEVEEIQYGALSMDKQAHTVLYQGEIVPLTKTEMGILHILLRNVGGAINRSRIIEHLFGEDFEGEERTVDSHVRNLRSKLKSVGFENGLVESVWGVGYRIPRLKES